MSCNNQLPSQKFLERAATEAPLILLSYLDAAGKTYALGKKFHGESSEIRKLWYVDSHLKTRWLNPDHLVEVERQDKHGNKPQVRLFADKTNPRVKRYKATLVVSGKEYAFQGYCLEADKGTVRAKRALAAMCHMSFEAVNSQVKQHPNSFSFNFN